MINFNVTSIILIYANADIFSCAIIAALYGTLSKPKMNDNIENWNTQLAAYKRSSGMFILQLRNHTPTSSATKSIKTDMPN